MRWRIRRELILAAAVAVAVPACATGLEPNGCGSDLRISVAGGAEIEFEWNEGCSPGPDSPYRERGE